MEQPDNTTTAERELPRVLIVDDEPTIRVALGRGLRRLGSEILEAQDGEVGLTLAVERQPHVIFLDLRMPGIDGHTFLRRLAATGCDAAVVVMSGQGRMEDVVDVLRAGAADYLKKPWNPAELLAAFSRAVEINAHRRKLRGVPKTPPPESRPAGSSLADVVERVRSGDLPVPSVPSVLLALRSMVRRPDISIDAIAAKIEQDQRLSADLVRMSNTPVYARNGRNLSVREAVARIGLRGVHGIVETLSLQTTFQSASAAVNRPLSAVWRNAVARGLSMRAVADLLASDDRVNDDVAYLIGLLSDVGASFLLWVGAQRGSFAGDGRAALSSLEKHHEEASAAILGRWGFDEEIITAVRHHHSELPPTLTSRYWPIAVLGASLAAEVAGTDITHPAKPDQLLVDRCAAELQIGAAAFSRLLLSLKNEYDAIVPALGSKLP
jgi:HD-like signal output (HDOD) protein/CheY-like chemotaxis protein